MKALELFALFGLKVDKKSWANGAKAIKSLKMLAAGLAISSGVRSLTSLVTHASEAGTHILGMSKALGMSTKSFQEWSYVAKQAGSDGNQFAVGVSMFERNLREFAAGRGGKRFKDSMRDVHISAGEAKAALTGPDGVNDVLFKVADAYQKMGTSGKLAAINTGLFGQRARGMAQDLSQGSAALRAQIKHLHEIGGVVDESKLKNLKKFNNDVNDIKVAFNGLAMNVVGALAPALSSMAQSASKWIAENRDLISGALSVAIKIVSVAFRALGGVIEFVGAIVRGALGGNTGLQALLIGVAVVIASVLIPAVLEMIGTFSIALVTSPFGLMLLAVTALVFGILMLVKHWDQVKRAGGQALDWILGKLHVVGDFFRHLGQQIADGWHTALSTMKEVIVDALEAIADLPVIKQLIAVYDFFTRKSSAQQVTAGAAGDAAVQAGFKNPGAPFGGALDVSQNYLNAYHRSMDESRQNGGGTWASLKKGGNAGAVNLSMGATTVNITTKDAKEASDAFAEHQIDRVNRAAAAAVGGEIR